MGNCKSTIKEVRFIIEEELTHCYVYVTDEGDCPLGVRGWHHKAFPVSLSAIDILNGEFRDYLLWALEGPNETK